MRLTSCAASLVCVLVVAIVATSPVYAQQRWYVDVDAAGSSTGADWANAFTDLQDALDAASAADVVWVAEGTYRPGRGQIDQLVTFMLVDGVELYGGFRGNEIRLDERQWDQHPTILSGDLRGDDTRFSNNLENAHNVLRAADLSSTTVLDGFVVANGNANGPSHQGHKDNGGGLHISDSDLIVRHCSFIQNSARLHGGGVSCTFASNPVFESCTFFDNRVTGGFSSDGGGGLYVYSFSRPTIVDCRFERNHAGGSGGAFMSYWQNDVLIRDCLFVENDAWYGGAILGTESAVTIEDSIIRTNDALLGGGGLEVGYESTFAIRGSLIEDNIADDGGGIISVSLLTLEDSVVRNNVAAREGGGIFFSVYFYGVPSVSGCSIVGNFAQWGGGTYHRYLSEVVLSDCLYAGNTASAIGGGLAAFDDAMLTMRNLTVAGNDAPVGAGFAFEYEATSWSGVATITNSILWNDGDEIFNGNASAIDVTYSDVQDGYAGEGNMDLDPEFVDPTQGDYHLMYDSPCRNAGNNDAVSTMFDHEGDPRIVDGDVDLGADEFSPHLYFRGRLASFETIDACVIGWPGDDATLGLGSGVLDEPIMTPFGLWHLAPPINRRLEFGTIGPRGSAVLSQSLPDIPPDVVFPFQALIGDSLSDLEILVSERADN